MKCLSLEEHTNTYVPDGLHTLTNAIKSEQNCIFSFWSSFPQTCAHSERWPPHDGDPLLAGGCGFCGGQSVFLHLQRTQSALPEHQRAQRTLPVELYCWYVIKRCLQKINIFSLHIPKCSFTCIIFIPSDFSSLLPFSLTLPSPVFQALFGGLALLCFLAAIRHHSLSERLANYREDLFVLVVLEDSLDWSFWLGVGSVATHFAVCGVVAMSRIKLPKPKIKKPEEPTVSSLDMLY